MLTCGSNRTIAIAAATRRRITMSWPLPAAAASETAEGRSAAALWRCGARPRGRGKLLQLDASAGLLELALELLGLVAIDALLDRLGGLVDERLGLLEAQAGGGADDLDHLDLLLPRRGQHDVDRARLLLGRAGSGVTGGSGCWCGGDRRGGHAELLLERLDQLGQLEDGHLLDLFDQLCCGGHC